MERGANTPNLGLFARAFRVLRHRWHDERESARAVPNAMLERVQSFVAASERRHSGEVRIAVEAALPLFYAWQREPTAVMVRERAVALFGKLGVWDTAANNGVLIYLNLTEHAIEVVADRGLNTHVGEAQWRSVVAHLSEHLRAGRYEDGLTEALAEVSALLVAHFPLAPGEANPNELSDAIERL